jgi:inosine/xanthosine triphosphatase
MPKIIVASQNPVKIEAVKQGFEQLFNDGMVGQLEVTGVSVPSGVPDQPMGQQETLQGAENRVKAASEQFAGADYYIGIEGGLEETDHGMLAFAWVVSGFQDGSSSSLKLGRGRSASFYLPEKIAALISQGKELGEADDIVFGVKNSKQSNGAVGILTDDAITRTSLYVPAVILSLLPFKAPQLYRTAVN